jgi:uncharacterized protein (TIGR00369 family)
MQNPEESAGIGSAIHSGHLGMVVTHVSPPETRAEVPITQALIAANGYLRAGVIVTLADMTAGYGCAANLPADAAGFTTLELKSNHLSTAREGTLECVARPAHVGRTTQVWDATVTHRESGRTIALFRCTQMVLFRREA